MAENAAPPGAAANGTGDSTRGIPYYEKLRRDLRESIEKKKALDRSLADIETTIQGLETSYLEETTAGNIIKGFDNYIKGSTGTTAGAGGARRKQVISEADRVFSRSSASFMKAQEGPVSGENTPSHAPTPTSSFAPNSARESNHPTPTSATSKAGSKKKKAADKQEDEDEGKPAKRGKITYGSNYRLQKNPMPSQRAMDAD